MATRTWIGGNSGDPNNWDQPLNWSDGLVPVAGDDVIIDATTSEPILSTDTAALLSITIDPGANLTIGTFALNAATAINSGTIISTDPSSDGVHLESGGVLTNSGTSSAISGGHLGVLISLAPGTVTNEGTITGQYGGVGIYGAGGGGVITNSGISSAIVGGVDGVLIQGATGTVNNQGTVSGTSSIGVYLAAGGTVTNSGAASAITGGVDGVLIRGAAGTVDNQGTVSGPSSIGVYLSAGGTVTNSGSVYGYDGVAVLGGVGTVLNQGAITGTNSSGLGVFLNAGGTVTNLGVASVISGGQHGVFISGAAGTVSNQGSIAGANSVGAYLTSGGLVTNSGASSAISGAIDGVLIRAVTGTVTNEGTITGTSLAGVDLASGAVTNLGGSSIISSDLYGVLIRYAAGTVTNQGTISATNNYGVYLGFGGLVTNSGSPAAITGGIGGVFVAGAAGTVTNAGTIEGVGTAGTGVIFSDLTGAFDNTLINSGDIIGDSGTAVQFGAGSDLLKLLPGASFTGLVNGGTGTNTLELAAGAGVGSVAGVGTGFTDFSTLQFDSGAQWAVAGNITGFGGTITGFSSDDSLDLTDFAAVSETFANNALVLSDTNDAQVTLQLQGGFSSGDFHLASDGSGGTDITVCYAAGTHILTETGERRIESLLHGDVVLTLAGKDLSAQPVKWIGRRRIDLTTHPRPEAVAPIRIRRNAFAGNVPHTDLLVSPDHAIFVDGKLICARQLVNGTTIQQEKGGTSVEYFHVELDAHAILLAEGLPAESYLNTGNQGFFANSDAPLTLHPDLADEADYPAREAGSCAPFVSDEDSVRPVWQRLADRAAALGHPGPQLDTTNDSDLHIAADGRTLRPLCWDNGLYIFVLPKDATEVRLISRAGSPTDVRPWLDDRRCLGMYVERIVLRDARDVQVVPIDHPDLSQGWWEVERDGTAMRRWTNGDAVLPLPVFDGPMILEIRASSGGMVYVTDASQDRRAA